ncbi:MAG: HAMP domain-containing histidine kinase [Myxococcus sp.]|nr:HAMP domain-containing histidine kinase [Myxococcus sp.]
MKLVTRLTAAFLLVVIFAISMAEWRRLGEEVEDFEADMDRTHLLVATTVADAVEVVTPRDGLEAARRIVEATGRHHPNALRVRWVCATPATDAPPLLPCDALGEVQESKTLVADERRVTVVPVRLDDRLAGAIEVSESPDFERTWKRRRAVAVVWLAVVTVASMAGFAFVLGWWLVARPTRALVNKARAVGAGDLQPDLTLATGDEFELLATEMNAMCAALARARDATASAMAAREAALEHLRHADRLATVGRLASGLAHELGTPLNVIEARASLIAEDAQAGEGAQASARVIIGQSEQVARLVRQLLVFARPRKLEPEPLKLDAVARAVAELLRPLADKRPVSLDVSGLTPTPATGDPVLLQQAVTNLVVNAFNACGAGGHVWLSTGRATRPKPGHPEPRGWVTLSVQDDGVGISPELEQSIFEPFFSTRPAGEGTGLGLPIVSSIIDEHGGFLTLDTARGHGSTFTLHLPEASA